MSKRFLTLAGMVLLALPAHASHIRGIRATITSLDAGAMAAEISVTAYNYEAFSGEMFLGYNATYPAIAWGEGEYLAVTEIPFVGTVTFNGEDLGQFRGAFSHTYSGPGPFTLQVATGECCAGTLDQIVTGVLRSQGGSVITETDVGGDFVTNTTVVDFSQVPATGRWALAALSLLLAAGGLFLLRR